MQPLLANLRPRPCTRAHARTSCSLAPPYACLAVLASGCFAAMRACVRADAYLEADGVGEAGLFAFRFKCPYCPTEQMTSQCRELHF